MQRARKRRFTPIIAAGLLLSACAGGQRPFFQAQICVANSAGLDHFKSELKSIARDEHLRYIEASRQTTRDLKLLKPEGEHMYTDGQIVNVGVEADGYGVTAGNLGLNRYQIALGFGPDRPQAGRFANRVVARLEQHWQVKRVPNTSGVLPNPTCTEKSVTPPNNSSKPTPLRGAA